MVGQGSKKVRADKKREVKPAVPLHLKKFIYSLSEVLDVAVKDLGEQACMEGIRTKEVMTSLTPYIRRDVRMGNSIYFGSPGVSTENNRAQRYRISIRFKPENFEDIALLSHSLDSSYAHSVSLLLFFSLTHPEVVYTLYRNKTGVELSDAKKKELRRVVLLVKNPDSSIDWKHILLNTADFIINGWRKAE